MTAVERQLAKPGVPDDDPAVRYAPRVYTQSTAYDGADQADNFASVVDPSAATVKREK